ncbi:SepM family pheromone-processing serine protease [Bacillus sp. EB600]|uniref:SepM family pheromone-processing serine protease n=1 Tax=Bacillus sp. EB600 TaxID=2806345 RepID=UPI00210DF8A1|nr:SepM family pheromone-processing serine protease [Bacillus sp. EB600]MCQ6279772.1 PDZ domain-containing protein [Bacillus sp. EB600]
MRKKLYVSSGFVLTLVLIAAVFYSLPYYISKPGMAKELEPIITVKNGYKEKGNFMLTTVRMGRANIYSYAAAKISKYEEIYPVNQILNQTETEEEYTVRQLYLMKDAKLNATDVAYHKAGLPVTYKYNGIYVLNVIPKMPAFGKLKAGDRIFKVDGQTFSSSSEFMDYVRTKKSGEEVTFTYSRKQQTNNVKIKVKPFKQGPKRVGIGISLVDDKEVIVHPPVKVITDEIGGPSAGLMFSLEIYNQLTKDDLTKGRQIAGTGTISVDGSVGPIGGIEQKIVAADKAGAEIFLAPNEHGMKNSNYRDALKAAHEIGSKMKIVPVDTFDEAVAYLEKLPNK